MRSCRQCSIIRTLSPGRVSGDCSRCAPSVDLPVLLAAQSIELLHLYPSLLMSGPFGGLHVDAEWCRLVAEIEGVPIDRLIEHIEALRAGYAQSPKK